MSGVKARLSTKSESANLTRRIKPDINILVSCVEEEDECDHRMGCSWVLSLYELLYANSLECEEQEHATGRRQEEETTSELLAQESSQYSPEQVPDCEDTIDEQLMQPMINIWISKKQNIY